LFELLIGFFYLEISQFFNLCNLPIFQLKN